MSLMFQPTRTMHEGANLYISGLSPTTTKNDLQALFQTFGNIISTFVMVDENGDSKCAGFVRFEEQDSADQAIRDLNGTIPGCNGFTGPLTVKPANKRKRFNGPIPTPTGARQRPASNVIYEGYSLFVFNLDSNTEENLLWQLFGPFGAVQSVKIITDKTTGKCKGFGFVTMSNYEEALAAIQYLNGYSLNNRILQVSFKKQKGET